MNCKHEAVLMEHENALLMFREIRASLPMLFSSVVSTLLEFVLVDSESQAGGSLVTLGSQVVELLESLRDIECFTTTEVSCCFCCLLFSFSFAQVDSYCSSTFPLASWQHPILQPRS